MQLNSC